MDQPLGWQFSYNSDGADIALLYFCTTSLCSIKCYDSTLWPDSGCVAASAGGVHILNNLFLISEFQVTLDTGKTGQWCFVHSEKMIKTKKR